MDTRGRIRFYISLMTCHDRDDLLIGFWDQIAEYFTHE